MTCAIRGDYTESQSAFMTSQGEVTFTFDFVPVGDEVYAELNIYRNRVEDNQLLDYNSPIHIYSGRSETATVELWDNYLPVEMNQLDLSAGGAGSLQGSDQGTPSLILYTDGKYLIEEDARIYSEGLWRTSPSIEGNPFENQSPFTLYLTECAYSRESQDAFRPVIVELPEEKEIKIENGSKAYFTLAGGAGRFSLEKNPFWLAK